MKLILLFCFVVVVKCNDLCSDEYNDYWKCPHDNLCLYKITEVCSVPPYNISRCPSGGDVGENVCTEEFCASLGLYWPKCPTDPYCISASAHDYTMCRDCPHGGKDDLICKGYFTDSHNLRRYSRCGIEPKYYKKETQSCNSVPDCPNGEDEVGCIDDESCFEKTNEKRPVKCPKDKVCVEDKARKCNCPSGYNDTVCTKEHCKNISLTVTEKRSHGKDEAFIKCPKDPKCIGSWQQCDGKIDCPMGGDEDECSKEKCAELGKLKCHNESRCINWDFVCDFDGKYKTTGKVIALPQSTPAMLSINKCQFSNDESDESCIESCHQQQKFACPLKLNNLNRIENLCISYNSSCFIKTNNENETNMILSKLPKDYLWRCSENRDEYIRSTKVCNREFNCALQEDESESTCSRFPLARAIQWASTIVLGLIVIRVCSKSWKTFTNSISCKSCMKDYQHTISEAEWIKKRRFLTLLFDNKCKELVSLDSFSGPTSNTNELEEAFKDVHDGCEGHEVKDIYKYVSHRVECKFTLFNMMNVMRWRHEYVYGKIYGLELSLHKNNETEVLKCLRRNLGTSKEAFEILDYKNKPTKITQLSVVFSTVLKSLLFHRSVMPIIKVLAFTVDLTKDIAFAKYMADNLFGEHSNKLTSNDDYYMFILYLISLVLGQALISVFALANRNTIFSVCLHQETNVTTRLLGGLVVTFFPVTGIVIATHNYFNEKSVDCDFDRIVQKINWSEGVMEKNEFEDILTKIKYVETEKTLGNFETMKMVESAIESFLQVCLVFTMLTQLPFEGIYNKQVFGIDGSQTLFIFISSSLSGFFFIGTSIVSYMSKTQKDSMSITEKILLIFIYLIQTSVSMAMSSMLFLLKSSLFSGLGYAIWGSLILVKMLFLIIFPMLRGKGKASFLETVIFALSNTNIPIHFGKFEDEESTCESKLKMNKQFVLAWIMSITENVLRALFLVLFGSNELLFKMLPGLTKIGIFTTILSIEIIILKLWHFYFHNLYIWNQLMNKKKNINQNMTSIAGTLGNIVKDSFSVFVKSQTNRNKDILTQSNENSKGGTKTKTFRSSSVSDCLLPSTHDRNELMETPVLRIRCKSFNFTDLIRHINTAENKEIPDNGSFVHALPCLSVNSMRYKNMDCHKLFSTKNIKKRTKSIIVNRIYLSCLLGILFISLVFISILSFTDNLNQTKTYRDCSEVQKNNQENGVYRLIISGETVYTYCKDGMTMIQKTDGDISNRQYYFDRTFKDYKDGYGFIASEYWIGLKNMLQLNENGNTVLRLELTRHKDGSQFWVEYDHFTMIAETIDNITYDFGAGRFRNDRIESYPILSVGNMTSSIKTDGHFILIRPTYLETFEEKKKKREYGFPFFFRFRKYHEDTMYASFTTMDMVTNYECAKEFHSGWWFPYDITVNRDILKLQYAYKLQKVCAHEVTIHTNLNGVYDQDINRNQRSIIFCNNKNIDDCILPVFEDKNSTTPIRVGWRLNGTESIKIKKSKMWLKRFKKLL